MGELVVEGGEELLATWRANQDFQLWCDSTAPTAELDRTLLENFFNVEQETISEVQLERRPPLYEVTSDGYCLILKGLDAVSESMDFSTIQIGFIRGERFLYSRHNGESLSTNRIWSKTTEDKLTVDLDEIVMQIVHEVNRRYLTNLLLLEKRLEEIEEILLEDTNDRLLEELAGYRTDLKKMRRFLDYHEQVIGTMMDKPPAHFSDNLHKLISKVHHSIERALSLATLYNDQITDLMESSLSLSSHRLNQVMKVLTIITVIFVPLSFLAGIYGMNFENIPELQSRYGYFILLGVMFSIVLGALYLFKKVRWL